MRVSYDWLKDMVAVPEDPADLSFEYIRTGTEVEGTEVLGASLDHVVTAQVLTKEPHPDSDHMWLTTVDTGADDPVQIVCGAQNFEAGDHIVTACIGAELPGGFKIKKSKLRGVDSYGMNCSARELGFGSDASGILILPENAPVGVPFAQYAGLADTILDCEITPNRPDCLSMVGMARETGAILDHDMHVEYPTIKNEQGTPTADEISVEIADASLCDRYVARIVRNVTVGDSPDWLVARLNACGIRPINNIVDITNYVMMLTGQPLHAFDLDTFADVDGHKQVVVKAACEGDHFTTLDGVERTLSEGMAMINDGTRDVALAGVMGGEDSEITEKSVNVLIESACFNAGRTSHTSRDLTLISDASIRFERQVDVTGCADVATIAAALMEQLAGGTPAPGMVDVYPNVFEPKQIHLRYKRVESVCGASIDPEFIQNKLVRLGCKVTECEDGLDVEAPSFRPDLLREIDLIEEILRLWGMDRVEATIPAAKNHIGGLTRAQKLERKIGSVLRSCGLNETSTFSFAAPGDLDRLGMSEEGRGVPVVLMNPLVAEQTQMRRTLLTGLLNSVAYNEAHGTSNVQLYEIGELFFGNPNKSQPRERKYVGGVMSGCMADPVATMAYQPLRFFDGKGVIEELLDALRMPKVRFRVADPEEYKFLQPGRAAEVMTGGTVLGWLGEIHPDVRADFDIDNPVVAFELNLEALISNAGEQQPYQEFSNFPAVSMDLALVVDKDVTAEMLMQRIASAGGKLLVDVRLFDIYVDAERLGENKKSMAFSLTYQAADHTLTADEVQKTHQRVVTKVCKSTGGEVRS